MPRNTVNGNKREKGYFFTVTAVNGNPGFVFLDDDKPSEQTMRDLVENVPFFDTENDQAKLDDSSSDLYSKSGLVVLATDTQAINKEVKPSNRTLVTQPSQLSSVSEETTQDVNTGVNPFTGETLVSVLPDAAITTRSDYRVKLNDNFVSWLVSTFDGIRSDISDNTAAINTINTTDIPDLQGQIDALSSGTGDAFLEQIPVGVRISWPSNVLPSGDKWLFEDGSTLSTVTYPELYAVIGTQFGTAGINTFNLNDTRGKFEVSRLIGDPEFGTFGATGGSKTQTLTIGNLPPHTHEANGNGATINILNSGSHFHSFELHDDAGNGSRPKSNGTDFTNNANTDSKTHTHPNSVFAGVVGNGAGLSEAFNILPPYSVTGNMIIKAKP